MKTTTHAQGNESSRQASHGSRLSLIRARYYALLFRKSVQVPAVLLLTA